MEHLELWDFANSLGMDYIISPWDEHSLDFLVKNKAKVIKIPNNIKIRTFPIKKGYSTSKTIKKIKKIKSAEKNISYR